MRLQSRCRTELPSPEDLTGLEDPHPRCLAYMTSKLVLAVGMSTQAMWTSPWGSLQQGSWLLTERGTDRHRHGHTERESSAMPLYHFRCFLARIKSLWPVFTQGETSHRTWSWDSGITGAISETACHLIKGKLLPHNSSPQWNTTYLFLSSFKKKFVSSVSSFFNV